MFFSRGRAWRGRVTPLPEMPMSSMTELLDELVAVDGGSVQTSLRGVRLFKDSKPLRRRPLLYSPGICIIASGYKIGHLGGRSFRYDADNYLVTSITMPFECESFPTADEPLRGLFIDTDMAQLNDLINQMDVHLAPDAAGGDLPLGIGPSALDADMKDATLKLLKVLRSERDARILGPGLIREIHYRALCGSQAPVLHSLTRGGDARSQVMRVIGLMESDCRKKFDTQQLANAANMSVSAFHKAFREITADSPLQYLKKIRLAHARDLIIRQKMRANMAAGEVGYESPSQFSREFKRYFGESPADVIRERRII